MAAVARPQVVHNGAAKPVVPIQESDVKWAFKFLGDETGLPAKKDANLSKEEFEKVRKQLGNLHRTYREGGTKDVEKLKKVEKSFKILEHHYAAQKKRALSSSQDIYAQNKDRKVTAPAQKQVTKASASHEAKSSSAAAVPKPVAKPVTAKSAAPPPPRLRAPLVPIPSPGGSGCGTPQHLMRSFSTSHVCTCGRTLELKFMEVKKKGDEIFRCPECRFRKMDPFNVVCEGRKGMLTMIVFQPPAVSQGSTDATLRFRLDLTSLKEWRKKGHNVEVRMLCLDTCDLQHHWPKELSMFINAKPEAKDIFQIEPPKPGHKRRDVPKVLSSALKAAKCELKVKVADPDGLNRFALAVVRTVPKPVRELVASLKFKTVEECEQKISNILFDSLAASTGEEVECQGSDKATLTCPLTMTRIANPCRGSTCQHLQCFDLEAYLLTASRQTFNQRWQCPVCSVRLLPRDLFVDQFVMDILKKADKKDKEIKFSEKPDRSVDWEVTAQEESDDPDDEDDEDDGDFQFAGQSQDDDEVQAVEVAKSAEDAPVIVFNDEVDMSPEAVDLDDPADTPAAEASVDVTVEDQEPAAAVEALHSDGEADSDGVDSDELQQQLAEVAQREKEREQKRKREQEEEERKKMEKRKELHSLQPTLALELEQLRKRRREELSAQLSCAVAKVTQLLRDMEDVDAVNEQLEKMGYNIGLRLVDEFLAKSGAGSCQDFRETAEVIAKVALRMFLGVSAEVVQWNRDLTACSLVLPDNPLAEYVELPANLTNRLWYSNLLCGVVRGALEQLCMKVECRFQKDMLNGDEHNLIRLELKEIIREDYGDD